MPIRINGEAKQLVGRNEPGRYEFRVSSGDVRLARTRGETQHGRLVVAGDRGEVDVEPTEELWAVDVRGAPLIDIEEAGFYINLFPRSVVGSVQADDGSNVAPASGAYVTRQGQDVDCNAATISEAFEAPDRADFVVVHVDDAAGSYTVTIEFTDALDGQTVTSIGADDDAAFAGSSTGDVFTRTAIASGTVRVRISDTSGASNPVDYSIYAR